MFAKRAPVPKPLLVLSVLLLAAGFAGAQGRDRDRAPAREYHQFSLSMGGGMGFGEGHHGLLDLKAEFQAGLTRRLRIGLGVGYLKDRGGRGLDGRDDRRVQPMGYEALYGGTADDALRARIMPVSLNVYYGLPIGRKWSVFMSGGGSWYRGTFEGPAGDQRKNAWGAQAGLGLEYRLAPSLLLVAEAAYRFVEFHDVVVPANNPLLMLANMLDSMLPRGAVRIADYLNGTLVPLAPKPVRTTDMNLGGLSVRMGVKFGL